MYQEESIYNLLPEDIVKAESVECFQRSLQDLARDCACHQFPHWQDM